MRECGVDIDVPGQTIKHRWRGPHLYREMHGLVCILARTGGNASNRNAPTRHRKVIALGRGEFLRVDAVLLNQAHEILLEHAEDQRNKGNESQALGATCSADAVLRLSASALARPAATPEPVGEPVAWRWMPSHVFPTWVYSDDQNRVADARRFMGDGGVQALYTRPAPGVPEASIAEAVKASVAAIYFADSSDYRSALWTVVRVLSPDLYDTLGKDEQSAYELAVARLAAARAKGEQA